MAAFRLAFRSGGEVVKIRLLPSAMAFVSRSSAFLFGGVIVAGCGYLILKGLLQMHTAKFMCISPAGYFGVFLADESHKKFWGAGRDQTGKEVFLYFAFVGRIHLQFHICR